MKVKYLLERHLPLALLEGLRATDRDLDVVHATQTILRHDASDPELLDLAATEGRILVSRDKATMRDFAYERVRRGEPMSGLLVVRPAYAPRHRGRTLKVLISELGLIAKASDAEEWENVVQFIPFIYE